MKQWQLEFRFIFAVGSGLAVINLFRSYIDNAIDTVKSLIWFLDRYIDFRDTLIWPITSLLYDVDFSDFQKNLLGLTASLSLYIGSSFIRQYIITKKTHDFWFYFVCRWIQMCLISFLGISVLLSFWLVKHNSLQVPVGMFLSAAASFLVFAGGVALYLRTQGINNARVGSVGAFRNTLHSILGQKPSSRVEYTIRLSKIWLKSLRLTTIVRGSLIIIALALMAAAIVHQLRFIPSISFEEQWPEWLILASWGLAILIGWIQGRFWIKVISHDIIRRENSYLVFSLSLKSSMIVMREMLFAVFVAYMVTECFMRLIEIISALILLI